MRGLLNPSHCQLIVLFVISMTGWLLLGASIVPSVSLVMLYSSASLSCLALSHLLERVLLVLVLLTASNIPGGIIDNMTTALLGNHL